MTPNERARKQMKVAYERDPEKFRERARQWRAAHPGYYADRDASRRLVRRYGITLEQKQQMMEQQGNVCLLCERPFPSVRKACVDHCHTTGRIRGILCISCNHSIGNLGDSYETLTRVLAYLAYAACKQPFQEPVIPFPARAFVDA